ncbi:Selenide, water dikinase [Aduncisulcus paluster]|uniref:Selenide, water dikinase n=1 Tax=Aduncisulcus paluster TaxID=2918883 RepID=A0ABQ5KS02_9EUKA|nr:Selenide, water dikinase [Aduncisulcus paluster]
MSGCPLFPEYASVQLTAYTSGQGCACKLRPQALERALRSIAPFYDPALLVGTNNADDACVYDIGDGRVLVSTVDFFTPVVDDPVDFGRIAASNALSDVYAMNAKPIFALAVCAFPSARLPESVLTAIMNGATEKCAEAGIAIAGGHTIDDPEVKFGLCVVGICRKDEYLCNNTPKPGNILLLTKKIGTGIISTALKNGYIDDESVVKEMAATMGKLNREAAECVSEVKRRLGSSSVTALTDVTGFGLGGHLYEMLSKENIIEICTGQTEERKKIDDTMHHGEKKLGAILSFSSLPFLDPVIELVEDFGKSTIPGGTLNNMEWLRGKDAMPMIAPGMKIDSYATTLVCDAQTSGGLLISCTPDAARELKELMKERGSSVWEIGKVKEWKVGDGARVEIIE